MKMETEEILWDEVQDLLIKAMKIVGVDPYDSDNINFNLRQRTGISVSWRSFMDHPKYGGSDVYFERCSKE
ncbi:MAG: hypothetical protein HOK80_05650 [Candidatus Cloacimonetes bacterium]|mgnify:CR=1 FL=1|jgi:hypothetical protein|nr:hypothetical protein [Candidatus Cloacimonadota bacterium]